jgi:hypothetical protein
MGFATVELQFIRVHIGFLGSKLLHLLGLIASVFRRI